MKVTITVDDCVQTPPAPAPPETPRASEPQTVADLKTITVVIPQPPRPNRVISVPKDIQDAIKKLVE